MTKERVKIFNTFVNRSGECWTWTGQLDDKGYGVYCGKGAHRIAYAIEHGGIKCGWHIHHMCENKLCVRPSHLKMMSPAAHRIATSGREMMGRLSTSFVRTSSIRNAISYIPRADLAILLKIRK